MVCVCARVRVHVEYVHVEYVHVRACVHVCGIKQWLSLVPLYSVVELSVVIFLCVCFSIP